MQPVHLSKSIDGMVLVEDLLMAPWGQAKAQGLHANPCRQSIITNGLAIRRSSPGSSGSSATLEGCCCESI